MTSVFAPGPSSLAACGFPSPSIAHCSFRICPRSLVPSVTLWHSRQFSTGGPEGFRQWRSPPTLCSVPHSHTYSRPTTARLSHITATFVHTCSPHPPIWHTHFPLSWAEAAPLPVITEIHLRHLAHYDGFSQRNPGHDLDRCPDQRDDDADDRLDLQVYPDAGFDLSRLARSCR